MSFSPDGCIRLLALNNNANTNNGYDLLRSTRHHRPLVRRFCHCLLCENSNFFLINIIYMYFSASNSKMIKRRSRLRLCGVVWAWSDSDLFFYLCVMIMIVVLCFILAQLRDVCFSDVPMCQIGN